MIPKFNPGDITFNSLYDFDKKLIKRFIINVQDNHYLYLSYNSDYVWFNNYNTNLIVQNYKDPETLYTDIFRELKVIE
jgi:hypothetical protein